MGYHFDAEYSEDERLADGTRVRVRMVRPHDKAGIREGFGRLSPQSRYRRFFSTKKELTDADLRFLTEFDGVNHFALGAALLDQQGREGGGVGVARFVRVPGEPEVAEFALAVVDDMQGRGVGRLLTQRLVAAALERGVLWFRCHLLADNERMQDLIEELWGGVIYTRDGAVLSAQFPLGGEAAERPEHGLADVLRLIREVARGAVRVPVAFGLALSEAWAEELERARSSVASWHGNPQEPVDAERSKHQLQGDSKMSDLKARFEQAALDSRELSHRPDDLTLLKLYALYKQASAGDVSGKRPGFPDFVGQAKYDAWAELEGTAPEDAMQRYVDLVEELRGREA